MASRATSINSAAGCLSAERRGFSRAQKECGCQQGGFIGIDSVGSRMDAVWLQTHSAASPPDYAGCHAIILHPASKAILPPKCAYYCTHGNCCTGVCKCCRYCISGAFSQQMKVVPLLVCYVYSRHEMCLRWGRDISAGDECLQLKCLIENVCGRTRLSAFGRKGDVQTLQTIHKHFPAP